MEEFSGLGTFWLPGNPDSELTGQLTFNHDQGVRLTIIGAFDGNQFSEPLPARRILGVVDGKRIALEECEPANSTLGGTGARKQEYRVQGMFIGHHFDHDEDLEFSSATVWLDDLAAWVDDSPISITDLFAGEGQRLSSTEARFEIPPPTTMDFDRGSITLGFTGATGGDRSVYRMRSRPYLKVTLPDLTPWQELFSHVGRLQDLITICTDRSCGIRKLTFEREDIPERALNGRSFGVPKEIEYRTGLVTLPRPEDSPILADHKMLLTMKGVGGLAFVASWLGTVPSFYPVLGSLMSTRYGRKLYVENRYLNTVASAESFHRLIYGGSRLDPEVFADRSVHALFSMKDADAREWLAGILQYANQPSLGQRLRRLYKTVKPAVSSLIEDAGRWSMAVSGARNRLTHLEDMGRVNFDSGDLYWLAESVFDLTRICLLRQAGLTDSHLAELGSVGRYNWYQEKVTNATRNVRQVLLDYENAS